jgi:hypothetical protein
MHRERLFIRLVPDLLEQPGRALDVGEEEGSSVRGSGQLAALQKLATRAARFPALSACYIPADRRQSGYSSFRQVRGSAGWVFGVRSSRKL